MKYIESKFDPSDFIDGYETFLFAIYIYQENFVSSLGVKWFNMTPCVDV